MFNGAIESQAALESRWRHEAKTTALELWRRTARSERFFAHLYAGEFNSLFQTKLQFYQGVDFSSL
jgi:hypothetical protein